MKKLLRITALVLATAAIVSLSACGKPGGTEVNLEGGTIKITVPSHASWPYQDSWKVFEYMEEGTNTTIDVQAIPESDFYTKIPIIFATPKDLPDLVAFDYKPATDKYTSQGALIALDDHLDIMPNYTAFLDTLPEDERASLLRGRKAADGKIYYAPVRGTERLQNVKAWLYRKDIFDKNNLKTPETMDELYDVALKLKEIYPESYPICMRQGLNNVNVIGSSWKPYFNWGCYYDYATEEWHYGAREDTMREIVEYLIKLSDAKLVPPDFLTINTKSWEELITTGRGFMMPEYQTRIDFFNPLGTEFEEGFNITAMIPPYVKNGTGVPMVSRENYDPKGLVVCNTGDDTRIENTIRFIDWLYTDEACELMSWGKEGETYKVVDGKKEYILDEAGNSALSLYGIQSYGSFLRFDAEAAAAAASPALTETTELCLSHTLENFNPITWLAYNEEEESTITGKGIEIRTYVQEMLAKFILKQEPLSKWDEFTKTIDDMGVETVLAAYKSAYDRVK